MNIVIRHGVCGLPRFSIRSIVAVGCFMTFGICFHLIKLFL